MKIPINLASSPYENLRPYYTGAGVAALVLLALALLLVTKERQDRQETRLLTEQTQQMEREQEEMQQEQQVLEQWLATPAAQQIQAQSAFLNSLLLRKSLSWTQMFMDLEKILPARAQVVSIRPSLNSSAEAELSLTVVATETGPLVEFLKNLESTPRFGSPVVQSQQFSSTRAAENTIRMEVSTPYRQTPGDGDHPTGETSPNTASSMAQAGTGPGGAGQEGK
ncbi:MAG: hypothetical protein HYS38_08175 [Acidobacteria bacterium]|nr:hypothetical protein [Acidobacteriota bacterium]